MEICERTSVTHTTFPRWLIIFPTYYAATAATTTTTTTTSAILYILAL